MKFIFTILSAFFILNVSAQTTDEIMAFNYATKGLKSQLDNGLDPDKENYLFAKVGAGNVDSIGVRQLIMYHKITYAVACKIVIAGDLSSSTTDKLHFFCIPGKDGSEAFWKMCLDNINAAYAKKPQEGAKFWMALEKSNSRITNAWINASKPKK